MKNIKTKWDYSYLAKNYDHRAEYDKTLIKKILKFINCKANYPVGDIGAGTGKLTKLLLKEDLIVSAVEPNLQMRKFGIKNCNKFIVYITFNILLLSNYFSLIKIKIRI